jgi:AcrR family transcriptional regulator
MARDADETRRRLLAAARGEFTRHGLAGARVDRIAADAGVNKERIYAHFGNKDQLFDAVLADSLAESAAAMETPAQEGFGTYVERKLAYHAQHPEAVRLLLWEALERPGSPFAAQQERGALYDAKAEALADLLGKDDTQARYAMMVGLALGTVEQAFPVLTALVLGDHADRQAFRDYLSQTAARAVDDTKP